MKKEYIKPTALAVALASEGCCAIKTTSSIEISGSASGTTEETITTKGGYLTNQEKPGAGLWDK